MTYEEMIKLMKKPIPNFADEACEEERGIRYFELITLEKEVVSAIDSSNFLPGIPTKQSDTFKKKLLKKHHDIKKLVSSLSDDLLIKKSSRITGLRSFNSAIAELFQSSPDLSITDVCREIQRACIEKYELSGEISIEDYKGAPSSSNFTFEYYVGDVKKYGNREQLKKAISAAKKYNREL